MYKLKSKKCFSLLVFQSNSLGLLISNLLDLNMCSCFFSRTSRRTARQYIKRGKRVQRGPKYNAQWASLTTRPDWKISQTLLIAVGRPRLANCLALTLSQQLNSSRSKLLTELKGLLHQKQLCFEEAISTTPPKTCAHAYMKNVGSKWCVGQLIIKTPQK